MTQDEMKRLAAEAALDYVQGGLVGVGTGSTVNQDDQVNHLVIQPDGSIIAVGTAVKNVGSTGFNAIGIIKLTSSGVLDTSFDGDGKASTVH